MVWKHGNDIIWSLYDFIVKMSKKFQDKKESCILDIFKLFYFNLAVSLLDKETYHKVLVTKLLQDCLDGFLAAGCQKCVLYIIGRNVLWEKV